jgi:hypothetical protein
VLRSVSGRCAVVLRELGGRKAGRAPSRSTGPSGVAKRRKGSIHFAVDTLGHLRALKVPPADQGTARRSLRWPKRCSR